MRIFNNTIDGLDGREEEEEGERLTLGFLPDEIKTECKKFLLSRDVENPQRFRLFKSISHLKVKHLSCGAMHVCVVTFEGDVYTWGDNSRGQCGLGKREEGEPIYISYPSKVKMFESVKMSS